MDEDVASWILEFVLCQDKPEWFVNELFRILPLSSPLNPRLKKRILLRRITRELVQHSISEKTLLSLELIEEIDRDHGVSPSDNIKAAYCAVAVNCTVKSLRKSHDDFMDAVYRIWLYRVSDLERSDEAVGLISDELKGWKKRMGDALTSPGTRDQVLKMDVDALESVRVYLRNAKEEMGPPFIEHAAEAFLEKRLILGEQSNNPPVCVVGYRSHGREKSSQSLVDEHRVSLTARGQDATNQGEFNANNPQEVCTVGNRSSGVERTSRSRDDHELSVAARGQDASNQGEHSTNKFGSLITPEVWKVKKALKASRADLETVVEDPLPDAIIRAAGVLADKLEGVINLKEQERKDSQVNKVTPVFDVEMGAELTCAEGTSTCAVRNNDPNPSCSKGLEGNQSRTVMGALVCSTEEGAKFTNTDGTKTSTEQNKGPDLRPNRSLMDRNPTAHTYEWDDSIESASEKSPTPSGSGSPAGSPSGKPCLPTPKRRTVSPLKLHEVKNIVKRRRMKKWTLLEEDTLREAVKKHGKGNWKLILNCHHKIFEERTEVDLKDKWRNMTRSFPYESF